MQRTILAFAFLLLVCGTAFAASTPFARLEGQWSGGGVIQMSNGSREALRCRASYDVQEGGRSLQLSIRCASESYNFNLQSSANYASGRVTGVWSESTLNARGTLSGRAEDGRISVMASGQTFSASLTLTTRGNRQTVAIRASDPQSSVQGASIELQRS
jgi:hypothetical protein